MVKSGATAPTVRGGVVPARAGDCWARRAAGATASVTASESDRMRTPLLEVGSGDRCNISPPDRLKSRLDHWPCRAPRPIFRHPIHDKYTPPGSAPGPPMSDHAERLRAALAGHYDVAHELGAGGMATVYLAQDLKHNRKVAIKVLRPELAAVIGAERFVREIRTIAALQHPHILGLIDSGEVQGTAYYVMPFVDGESLRDRLTREKQLPIADAVWIASEIASALDYAHRHGVIHRDIKPENILLHDGQALVADFGIALAVTQAGGTRMTETGMSLGTPHYMSPEQAMGERDITARSDVYALGCVTYEMLIGDPPFTGSTAQAIV